MDEKNLEDMQQKQKEATTILCDNLFTIAMAKKSYSSQPHKTH